VWSLLRALVALGIFLAVGESLARALDIVDRLNGYSRVLFARAVDPELPFVLRPGMRGEILGTQVRTNSLGFRGEEVAPAPAPGVRRILMLGDSVVFGHGVREDETVAAVLARRLNAEGSGTWEVINAGLPAYDTPAEARLLETVGLALAPAIAVVGTSLNDYDPAPVYSPLGILTRRDVHLVPSFTERSEFLVLLRWLVNWSRGELWHQVAARLAREPRPGTSDLDRLVEATHLRFYREPAPAEWERLRGGFATLGRIARERQLPLLVAIFPESYQVRGATVDLTPQRRLLALCGEAGLRCLDLQPAFAAAAGELFLDAQHPNARGLAIAADAIAAALSRGTGGAQGRAS
jgi:lysophospholipase L1-like esterase